MRKIFLALVIVLWILAGIQITLNINKEDAGKLVEAFSQTNYITAESKVTAYGSIQNEYMTKEEQEEFLIAIANEIGITKNYEILYMTEDNRKESQLYKDAAKAATLLKIVTIESEVEDNLLQTSQYLILELSLYDGIELAVKYKERIEGILKNYPVRCDYGIGFDGEFQGKITLEEKNRLTDRLLEDINAKIVTENRTDDLYTVYAYTEIIDEYRLVQSEKINVNIALSYDESLDVTHLYVASPMIDGDY